MHSTPPSSALPLFLAKDLRRTSAGKELRILKSNGATRATRAARCQLRRENIPKSPSCESRMPGAPRTVHCPFLLRSQDLKVQSLCKGQSSKAPKLDTHCLYGCRFRQLSLTQGTLSFDGARVLLGQKYRTRTTPPLFQAVLFDTEIPRTRHCQQLPAKQGLQCHMT